MFCENCGKPNDDGAKFCEFCGTPMASDEAPVATAPAEAAPVATAAAPKVSVVDKLKAIHQKNKLLLPIVAGALVLVIVVAVVLAVVLTGNAKKVDMTKYLQVELSGCDGYGKITYEFDSFNFFLRLTGDKSASGYGAVDPESLSEEDQEAITAKGMEYMGLLYSIDVTMELPEGRTRYNLQNGDKVVFKVTCDTSLAAGLDGNIIPGEYVYEVKDLEDAMVFNVLDYYDLVFEGYNGYGSYELVCKEKHIETLGKVTLETRTDGNFISVHINDGEDSWTNTYWIEVNADSYRYLSNGETVTLYASYLDADEFAEYGVILEGLEKEMTVSGLKEAVEFDLLENLVFQFSGLNGDGDLDITSKVESVTVGDLVFDMEDGDVYYNGDYVTYFRAYASQDWNLSNGEVVTITLSYYPDDLARYGVTIKADSMEVTVSGLGEYATDLESVLNASNFADLDAKAQEEIMNNLYDDWSWAVHGQHWGSYSEIDPGEDLALYKSILTTPKSTNSWDHNDLWLVYSITLDDNSMDPTVYYFTYKVDDIVVMGDGTLKLDSYSFNTYRGETDYQAFYDANIGIDSYKLNIYE